jgi:sulfite reductase (NADPH) flavoprotein alpha-component
MKRDIKKEFKELVRISTPVEKIWMSGYLESSIDEDIDPLGYSIPKKKEDKPSEEGKKSTPEKDPESEAEESAGSEEKYLSMVGTITPTQSKEASDIPPVNTTASSELEFSANGSEGQSIVDFGSIPKTALIGFGTETGNSKKLAASIQQKLKPFGLKVKVSGTNQIKVSDLAKEELFICVISTHGDGEPPEAAKKFHADLNSRKESLTGLRYAVLALGDTSYPLFCKAGQDVDEYLNRLGAERLVPTGLCDVDYEETANSWISQLLGRLSSPNTSSHVSAPKPQIAPVRQSQDTNLGKQTSGLENGKSISKSTEKKTITGRIRANFPLTDTLSSKEIRHIEIESDFEIPYLPGDSVGVFPKNDSKTVKQILKYLRLDSDEKIDWRGQSYSAKSLLEDKLSIRYLSARVQEQYENFTGKKIPKLRLDLIDLLEEFPLHESADRASVLGFLDPMPPRYYSISSSPEAHGKNEVHITVADVDIQAARRQYRGLCTGNLFEMEEGTELEFRIQKNDNFRLPESSQDCIMIGPGTGIAPFRSFLFERESLGHSGKNWLIFGNRNFAYDFLYQTELLEFFDTGVLSKFNTAFSRDSDKKVYVQDKLWDNRKEFLEWMEKGAILYVCGSKDPMSADLDKMIVEILHEKHREGRIKAKEILDSWIEEGRYKKDVY